MLYCVTFLFQLYLDHSLSFVLDYFHNCYSYHLSQYFQFSQHPLSHKYVCFLMKPLGYFRSTRRLPNRIQYDLFGKECQGTPLKI